MPFIRNAWYAGAWSEDVSRALVRRTVLEEPIVLYRTINGEAVALGGICPHRFAPLHLGALVGDAVECPYHGLQFSPSGACSFNPHGDGTLPRARTKSYPVLERHTLVWIWMGDPQRADPALIPDYACLDDPNFRTVKNSCEVKGNYRLMIDNIIDVAHLQYVHRNTAGQISNFRDCVQDVVQEGNTVHDRRTFPRTKAPRVFAQLLDDGEALVDFWADVRFDPPGCLRNFLGVAAPGRARSEGISQFGSHILTPATEDSHLYFYAVSRNYSQNDPEVDERWRNWQRTALLAEDKPMIEAVEAMTPIARRMGMKEVYLTTDVGARRAGRVIDALIAAEQES